MHIYCKLIGNICLPHLPVKFVYLCSHCFLSQAQGSPLAPKGYAKSGKTDWRLHSQAYAYEEARILCIYFTVFGLEGRQNNKADLYGRIVDSSWQLSLHSHWRKVNRMLGFMRESMSEANRTKGRKGRSWNACHL